MKPFGHPVRIALAYLLVCAGLIWPAVRAATPAQHWLARADAQALDEHPGWRALLHYEPRWLSRGQGSIISSPWFFLADRGRSDARAELAATLAALLDGRVLAHWNKPAACVFPARRAFLADRLPGLATHLPDRDCPEYARWRARLEPRSASLVFPSAYLNSPASMFGHTLLRLDGTGGRGGHELLSYAVNFAARTQERSGLTFAFKGLTGGYDGRYDIYPYYEKVKQYAWIENRDVWSYPLALTREELVRLQAHLWELREVGFDYFFVTKNCSYQLLALLQVVRPGLELTQQFRLHAIPAETIQTLSREPGLLGAAAYRPALRTELTHGLAQLSATDRDRVAGLAAGRLDPTGLQGLAPRRQIRVLELAHDYLFYRHRSRDEPASAAREARMARLLLARSGLTGRAELAEPPAPSADPSQGHGAFRLSAGPLWSDDERGWQIGLRPAYHDALDPPAGFVEGAEVQFLRTRWRVDADASRARLDYLGLVEIESRTPRDGLFRPVSWRVKSGMRRLPSGPLFEQAGHPGGFVEGGPGLAWAWPRGLLASVFALAGLDYNTGVEDNHAAAAGLVAGLDGAWTGAWRWTLEAGWMGRLSGDPLGKRRWVEAGQQLDLSRQTALRLELGYESRDNHGDGRVGLALLRYF